MLFSFYHEDLLNFIIQYREFGKTNRIKRKYKIQSNSTIYYIYQTPGKGFSDFIRHVLRIVLYEYLQICGFFSIIFLCKNVAT